MAGLLWIVGGGVVVVGGVLWALVRSQSGNEPTDLGTISSQWMAERRAHEREASDR